MMSLLSPLMLKGIPFPLSKGGLDGEPPAFRFAGTPFYSPSERGRESGLLRKKGYPHPSPLMCKGDTLTLPLDVQEGIEGGLDHTPPSRSARGRERSERGMPCHAINAGTPKQQPTQSLNPSQSFKILVHPRPSGFRLPPE